jgi:alkanesulfonate monooxygenase SsuD/methylene tetrahydromethanopterin reductase-like flavin-dependent oxidoreductase (luciferase family)
MKFGIFYEHQLPAPGPTARSKSSSRTPSTRSSSPTGLGIDFAWEVEHHFLEEYSHLSCPEVFLAAASQRTKNIRWSTDQADAAQLQPPGAHRRGDRHPRSVSNGRVEFGTGESASRAELEGFGINPMQRREMWRETTEQVCNMLAMDPYPGFQGKYFSMPVRNVVPKPVQKPHPPLWVACSNRDTIHLAAQLGIGALTFAFVDPAEAQKWVTDYYETFKKECVPIGHTVNPNVAMVTSFSCHPDAGEAYRRGFDGFKFFQFGLGHHYVFGNHKPGRSDIWANYNRVKGALGEHDLDFSAGAPTASAPRTSFAPTCAASATPASTRPCSSSRVARTSMSTYASRSNSSGQTSCPSSRTKSRPARRRRLTSWRPTLRRHSSGKSS